MNDIHFRYEWMRFTKGHVWERDLYQHDGFLQMWLQCRVWAQLQWQVPRWVIKTPRSVGSSGSSYSDIIGEPSSKAYYYY